MLVASGTETPVQASMQVIRGGQDFHSLSQGLTAHRISQVAYFTHVKTALVGVTHNLLHTRNLFHE
jgi:hypothetical protein